MEVIIYSLKAMDMKIFIITIVLFTTSSFAFDKKRINYDQRLAKLKKVNYSLAYKVRNVAAFCFSKPFRLDRSSIKLNPKSSLLAKLHIIDMEKGVSHKRGLDRRRKKEKGHPGRQAMDLVTDMIRDEIKNTEIKTYQVLMKIACSANRLLARFTMSGHIVTSAENKVTRSKGGNCWDNVHVSIRLGNALGIPLKRETHGIHMFFSYKIRSTPGRELYFGVDPLYCSSWNDCTYEFLDRNKKFIGSNLKKEFLAQEMKSEKCYIKARKRDPNFLLYYK